MSQIAENNINRQSERIPAAAPVEPRQASGFDTLMTSLSPDEHIKGRQFEEISSWLLRQVPLYSNRIRQVYRWRDWPHGEGIDDGIDLVAETNDGHFWAIQCKGYAPEYFVKKSDLDSFISAAGKTFEVNGVKRSFDYRLLIASTDNLGTTAERCLNNQEHTVGRLLRSDIRQLENEGLVFPSSIQGLGEAKRAGPKAPLPHQEEAVSDVCKGLSVHDRGKLISACGTGKTLEALWVAERLKAQTVLVACPSLGLISQTLRAWNANASEPFDYQVVCSDKTVVRNVWESWNEDVSHLGVPVTTDPAEVERFLGTHRDRRSVVFSTYQSLPVITESQGRLRHSFDLGIADEAHHCAGSGAGLFSRFLYDSQIRTRKRLFMTATPRIYSEAAAKRLDEMGVSYVDMDDETLFGPVLHRLSLRDAIGRRLLREYRVVVIGIKQGELEDLLNSELSFLTENGQTVDARTLTAQVALLKASQKYGISKAITFHNSIDRAKDFVAALPEIARHSGEPHLWAAHVNGQMRTSNRARVLDRLDRNPEQELSIVSNCACLGQGIDVPQLDCVAFIDPRGSQIDVVQNVGRVIRRCPGKELGTILIPVFLRDGEDTETLLASSRFASVYDTLRALRSHDPQLAATLDIARKKGNGSLVFKEGFAADRIIIDLDPHLPARISDAIHTRVLEKVSVAPRLSEELVIEWARLWQRKHGKWPAILSGPIGNEIVPGENWAAVNAALRDGTRGLPGGTSLDELLKLHGMKRNVPDLTEDQVLRWMEAWKARHGRWPSNNSGRIGEDIAPGESEWVAIDQLLRKGCRGLPGGSSLALLLERHGLKRHLLKLPRISEEQIISWARAWKEKHGVWPDRDSGPLGDDLAPGETWTVIDTMLSSGTRGYGGGSSLASLLQKHGLKRNIGSLPPVTEEQILSWARAWKEKHGKWPVVNSGAIGGDIASGETWASINAILKAGTRGLPGGTSLAKLLDRHGLKDNPANRPPLTEAHIVRWARAWKEKHGKWPAIQSGALGDDIAPGESWAGINAALIRGTRGFKKGPSLAVILERHGLKLNHLNRPPVTEEQIIRWAETWKNLHGVLPGVKSGPLGTDIARDENWSSLDTALRNGGRGLTGRSSLADLLYRHGLALQQPDLSPELILKWARDWKVRHGRYPAIESGNLEKDMAPDESWASIDRALRKGGRGLPGGSSLPHLLFQRKLKNTWRGTRPVLTPDMVIEWASAWKKIHGHYPGQGSGAVGSDLAPGENWQGLDQALRLGLRGLPGDSSLAQLFADRELKRNSQDLPDLTEVQIIRWARAWKKLHGNWPCRQSGPVTADPLADNWQTVDYALRAGRRGLTGGSSLAKLLEHKRLKRNLMSRPVLTEELILGWAKAWEKKHGCWPESKSGLVGKDIARDEDWGNISQALTKGLRGLKGGSSLADLLDRFGLKRNRKNLPQLTEDQVLSWARSWKAIHGEILTRESGMVGDAIAPGENWSSLDQALKQGLRGLPGNSSLARLLKKLQ